jgi:glycolate oxidase FAD binding subunit
MTNAHLNGFGDAVVIDGQRLIRIERPDTAAQLAEILAGAAADRSGLAPIGGGSMLGLGNVSSSIDYVVSTKSFNRVLMYEPTDLTLSVEAGATLAEVQTVLGEHGQWLPIDAPNPERATIGGLIATALSGPRRLGSETFRDLLIGISVAHPSGTVTKAGGLVVKNVTGFDMMRIYLGSLGTLGVIVSANFKTLPRPRVERTLFVSAPGLESALELSSRFLQSRVRPVALEIIQQDDSSWLVAARVEGRPGAVEILTGDAMTLAGDFTVQQLDGETSARWWQDYVNQEPAGDPSQGSSIRSNCRPRAVGTLATHALKSFGELNEARMRVSPGLGEVRLNIPGNSLTQESFVGIRGGLEAFAVNISLISASHDLKQGIDVWGEPPVTIDLMRALKEQFDPTQVLNPGRFAGFI